MAFNVAIVLAGLELKEFNNLSDRLVSKGIDRSVSPGARSDSSNSSGFHSLPTSIESIASQSSRAASPSADIPPEQLMLNVPYPSNGQKNRDNVNFCGLNPVYQYLLKVPTINSCNRRSVNDNKRVIKRPVQRKTSRQQAKVVYKNKDILNLGANIRAQGWHPSQAMSNIELKQLSTAKSIHYRLSHDGLSLSYPLVTCGDCDFAKQFPDLLPNVNEEQSI